VHEPVLGHLVLDQRHDRRGRADRRRHASRSKGCGSLRARSPVDSVFLAGELAGDVVLVVADDVDGGR
jgi:hypothetical protein